jgi:hypothetical protein
MAATGFEKLKTAGATAPPSAAEPPPVVREWPAGRGRIVLVTMVNRSDEEQRDASDLVIEAFLRQRAPFAVIMDLRALSSYPATQREMYAKGRVLVRDVYKAYHLITVYLVKDERQRGFLTAIGWQVPSTRNSGPRVYTEDLNDAEAKCREVLTAR